MTPGYGWDLEEYDLLESLYEMWVDEAWRDEARTASLAWHGLMSDAERDALTLG
jgi:hypothetical protein